MLVYWIAICMGGAMFTIGYQLGRYLRTPATCNPPLNYNMAVFHPHTDNPSYPLPQCAANIGFQQGISPAHSHPTRNSKQRKKSFNMHFVNPAALNDMQQELYVPHNYPSHRSILLSNENVSGSSHLKSLCNTIVFVNAKVKTQAGACIAIVTTSSTTSSNLLRYDHRPDRAQPSSNKVTPTTTHSGFFRRVSTDTGRERLLMKFEPLLRSLSSLEDIVKDILLSRHLLQQSNITVMVVNQGEMDLYMNFVCSCHAHNISLHNVMVFAGSGEIVSLIEATGAMGVYHAETFAAVSKKASGAFLDKIFVDMMWYKSFSVWLLIKLHYNVLFQDVDLVWYKEPWNYFADINQKKLHRQQGSQHKPIDAFFSDDGSRDMRFSPFYGNTGYYFVLTNTKTLYWSWCVMTAFDLMHTSGSHQNVVTTRLQEAMDLANLTTHVLDSELFPTGKKYHHDKGYMKRLAAKEVSPYCFHMCWTANKNDKLTYLKQSNMWYVTSVCDAHKSPKIEHQEATYKALPKNTEQFTEKCCIHI